MIQFTISVSFSQLGSSISRFIFFLSCSVCIIYKPCMAALSHFLQNQCVPSPFFARNLYSSSEILLHTIHTHAEHISRCKAIVSAVFLHFPAHLGGAILDVEKFRQVNHVFGGYIKIVHSTCPLPNCLFFSSIVVYEDTRELFKLHHKRRQTHNTFMHPFYRNGAPFYRNGALTLVMVVMH